MGEDVEDVPGLGVDDGKPVDPVVNQDSDGVIQRGVGGDVDQLLGVAENT